MGIFLRGRSYHYDFIRGGKRYTGQVPIEGNRLGDDRTAAQMEALRTAAEEWEKKRKAELDQETEVLTQVAEDVRKNRTVRALVENYRFELTGGHPITLEEAPALARQKPWARPAIEQVWRQRLSHWEDFCAFIHAKYEDVRYLSDIKKSQAEAYIAYLATNGKFDKTVKQQGKASYQRTAKFTAASVHKVVTNIRAILEKLKEDAGLVSNPLEGIVIPRGEATERQIFSPEELQRIGIGIGEDRELAKAEYRGELYAQWESSAVFCRPLFLIASATGLTEGDICMLRWDEVDWSCSVIRHKRRKTRTRMVIPVLPVLADFLRTLPQEGEYILPKHANMYSKMKSSVSYRVKVFLNGMGIRTTETATSGRDVSIKDLHSMRHVFCYYATKAGIPISTIAKIVGHRTISMTEHYADHATAADLCAAVQGLPSILSSARDIQGDEMRERLVRYARTLPIEKVREALSVLDIECPTVRQLAE